MEIHYEDSTHTYYGLIGNRRLNYVSATTLLKHYYEQFDAVAKSIAYAEKHGGTPEYWQSQWQQIGDESADYGSLTHAVKEAREYESPSSTVLDTRNLRLINYHTLTDGIYPELKLWHHGYRIAGRADKCTIRTEQPHPLSSTLYNRFMDIDDYKTNKELKTRGYLYEKGRRAGSRKMMYAPLDHLEDCHLTHYTLQLSLYQYMAESLGFRPGKRTIIHCPKGGVETVHNIPYLRTEVEAMLNHAKRNKYIS